MSADRVDCVAMAKSELSPLLSAATAFDDQLAVYARLGELFLKTPLSSVKHLERANQLLGELAQCEQRLQDTGKQLVEALTAARGGHEELAALVVAHAPKLADRNAQLQSVMEEMARLASDAAKVTGQVAAGAAADPGAIGAEVLALATRAEQLATTARDSELEEVATQAHALHQKLKAVAQKLQRAGGN